ncbi:redoxin family protein [Oleiharenicola lentus]|uniref:redoxin family protein n=1 Tax=Oleiharenicola lentus TaxID=2508720 RepID=UPI003F67F381
MHFNIPFVLRGAMLGVALAHLGSAAPAVAPDDLFAELVKADRATSAARPAGVARGTAEFAAYWSKERARLLLLIGDAIKFWEGYPNHPRRWDAIALGYSAADWLRYSATHITPDGTYRTDDSDALAVRMGYPGTEPAADRLVLERIDALANLALTERDIQLGPYVSIAARKIAVLQDTAYPSAYDLRKARAADQLTTAWMNTPTKLMLGIEERMTKYDVAENPTSDGLFNPQAGFDGAAWHYVKFSSRFVPAAEHSRNYLRFEPAMQKKYPGHPGIKHAVLFGTPTTFNFTTENGTKVSTQAFVGRLCLVTFWSTDSSSSLEALRRVKLIREKYGADRIAAVGVVMNQVQPGAVERLCKEEGVDWPQYSNQCVGESKYEQVYGVNAYLGAVNAAPLGATIVLDQKGVLVSANLAAAGFEREIERHLGGGSSMGPIVPPADPAILVATGSEWEYSDARSLPEGGWMTREEAKPSRVRGEGRPAMFGWKRGMAPLGYGSWKNATVVSFGPYMGNRHIGSFYRRVFSVPDRYALKPFHLNVHAVGGVSVHINGVEVARDQLPAGVLTEYSRGTSASTKVRTAEFFAPAQILRSGENVVAVTLHNSDEERAPVLFDLELRALEMDGTESGSADELVIKRKSP